MLRRPIAARSFAVERQKAGGRRISFSAAQVVRDEQNILGLEVLMSEINKQSRWSSALRLMERLALLPRCNTLWGEGFCLGISRVQAVRSSVPRNRRDSRRPACARYLHPDGAGLVPVGRRRPGPIRKPCRGGRLGAVSCLCREFPPGVSHFRQYATVALALRYFCEPFALFRELAVLSCCSFHDGITSPVKQPFQVHGCHAAGNRELRSNQRQES